MARSVLSNLFHSKMEEYAARYDVFPASYEEVKRGYQEKYQNEWKKELIKDTAEKTGGKIESVRRQINRYDDGTRGKSGKGEKYGQAFKEIGKGLPPDRKIPKGKKWRVEANIYFQISKTSVSRKASATFSNLRGGLGKLLKEYREGGSLTEDDLDVESLEGLGAIDIYEL